MKQEFLKWFPHLEFTMMAMILFFTVFIVLVLKVTVFKNKELQEAVARLPLQDEDKGGQDV